MPTDRYGRMSDDMQKIAEKHFGKGELYPAEINLLRTAVTPNEAVCGPSPDMNDSSNDPIFSPQNWGREREVRADVIRWLCVDREAKILVDPGGIQLLGALITGELNLSHVVVPFPMRLTRCRLTEQVTIYSLHIPALDLRGSWTGSINADSSNVTHEVFFDEGFRAAGRVSFVAAHVGGGLMLRGSFVNKGGTAIDLGSIDVGGSMFLDSPFHSEGAVRLVGAKVGGDLDCDGGWFNNPGDVAIDLERAVVRARYFLARRGQTSFELTARYTCGNASRAFLTTAEARGRSLKTFCSLDSCTRE